MTGYHICGPECWEGEKRIPSREEFDRAVDEALASPDADMVRFPIRARHVLWLRVSDGRKNFFCGKPVIHHLADTEEDCSPREMRRWTPASRLPSDN